MRRFRTQINQPFMKQISNTSRTAVVLTLLFSLAMIRANAGNSDAAPGHAQTDNRSAIVVFKDAPLSTYVKTKPAQGQKIDFNNNTVKSYRAQLSRVRNNFKS